MSGSWVGRPSWITEGMEPDRGLVVVPEVALFAVAVAEPVAVPERRVESSVTGSSLHAGEVEGIYSSVVSPLVRHGAEAGWGVPTRPVRRRRQPRPVAAGCAAGGT